MMGRKLERQDGCLSSLRPVAGGLLLPASFLYPVRNKGKWKRGRDESAISHLYPPLGILSNQVRDRFLEEGTFGPTGFKREIRELLSNTRETTDVDLP